MKTPFERLGIDKDSDDEAVRQGYLKMVRKYPPDRYPEKFQRIQDGYELIRTEKKRLEYQLFHTEMPVIDEFVELFIDGKKKKKPTLKMIRRLLRSIPPPEGADKEHG
ncbi:J domain-containing protein [Desulfomarina sp.]